MAMHELDWSELNIPVEGSPTFAESYISSLPAGTMTIDGYFDWPIGEPATVDWPIGEPATVDWDGDGKHVFHGKVVKVATDDGGLTTWTLEPVKD